MNSILFLILRRMRRPLIAIIVSFAIAIVGLSLMPGVDNQGQPWRMSIFEAFYVISYTATTIGFGEIPFAYSKAQRLWMTFSIYLTVIPWFYAIGKIIALAQDSNLRTALTIARFAHTVKNLNEPFYIVCGYGEASSLLVNALDNKGIHVVVIESQQDKLYDLELNDTQYVIPNLCADAKSPEVLANSGVFHRLCNGVVTLTDDDQVNLAIAVAVKLMNPDLPVLARAEKNETAANMASFGTDHIINPYTLFGEQLAMKVHAIGSYILHEWLTDVPGDTLPPPVCPPIGKWVVCGYGRFGKSVIQNLKREQITTSIIEADPKLTGCEDCIVGNGTDSKTLLDAGIKDAVGLVAGTDNDINNLSIVMTAHEINPNLFVVIRKNKRINEPLFRQFNADITMQPSDIIAHECLAHMISPLLAQFLTLARYQSNEWSNHLISELVAVVGETVPETWAITLDNKYAPAITALLKNGKTIKLENLMCDPADRTQKIAIFPLMLSRANKQLLVPDLSNTLNEGDRILFCGRPEAKAGLPLVLNNPKTLAYLLDGVELYDSYFWRWLKKQKG